ncbi:unnamed protein product [Parascedosporium putredinis]|uniref:Uncharacterized protein n=1 Tax=Parascedosporium putredinis TaxID=1442378 RepID=A0A9P1H6J1_9PEZI|nr:unnamed protein product [Parascedosporium putredinis]CAI7998068.1 unnamed protein product [Parascedosporium putredinis]
MHERQPRAQPSSRPPRIHALSLKVQQTCLVEGTSHARVDETRLRGEIVAWVPSSPSHTKRPVSTLGEAEDWKRASLIRRPGRARRRIAETASQEATSAPELWNEAYCRFPAGKKSTNMPEAPTPCLLSPDIDTAAGKRPGDEI